MRPGHSTHRQIPASNGRDWELWSTLVGRRLTPLAPLVQPQAAVEASSPAAGVIGAPWLGHRCFRSIERRALARSCYVWPEGEWSTSGTVSPVEDEPHETTSRRQARRRRGIVQNVANQLAQIAVGWEITPDGPALPSDPASGVIDIDVVNERATVNGRPASLGMTTILARWTAGELERQRLGNGWLQAAQVTVSYSRTSGPANMESRATVGTDWGAAEAASANSQYLPLDWPPRRGRVGAGGD